MAHFFYIKKIHHYHAYNKTHGNDPHVYGQHILTTSSAGADFILKLITTQIITN